MSGSASNLSGSYEFRSVLDHVPAPCWIHTAGRVRYANTAFAQLAGAGESQDLVGMEFSRFFPPYAREALSAGAGQQIAAGSALRTEATLIALSGSPIDVEINSRPVEFEGERCVLAIVQDISMHKRAHRAAHEAEVRLRRLVDANLIGVIEVGPRGILEANDVFLKMTGRSREQIRTGTLTWDQITPPEYLPADREKVQELLQKGEAAPFEKECFRADGSRIQVMIGSSLIAPPPEWRAIAFVLDLTDRRRLQELRAERLRLESIGVLAAGMAHNLNNLLTAVIGNASLLIENHLIGEDQHARRVASEIIQSGERAALLTSQLLAYAGQGRFLVAAADIRALIEAQLERVRADVPSNVRIKVDLPERLPAVLVDNNQMRHVVVGLVVNAVEAVGERSDGEVVVAARREVIGPDQVFSRAGEPLPAGGYCVIEVRDNGAGMDDNTLAHAFDPFFSTKFPGRGLGLAAVAGIVHASRGAVRVHTTPGEGSVFQVYLPEGIPQE